jgi:hypothetical protein
MLHVTPAASVRLVAGGIVAAPLELPDEVLEPPEELDELELDELLELLLELDDPPEENVIV